jgi:hypothetical protein
MTTKKAGPSKRPARKKSSGWAAFWKFCGLVVLAGKEARGAARRSSSGQGRPARVPTAMRPPKVGLPGGTSTKGGASGKAAGGGLREFRTVEEVWAGRGDKRGEAPPEVWGGPGRPGQADQADACGWDDSMTNPEQADGVTAVCGDDVATDDGSSVDPSSAESGAV